MDFIIYDIILDTSKVYKPTGILYVVNKTVGLKDSKVRLIIGSVAGTVSLASLILAMLPNLLSLILGIISIIMLGTAYTGLCPMYSALGFSTADN